MSTKHEAKIAVYMTPKELLALDHTILEIRRVYGVKVDRSRYVREALHVASARGIAGAIIDREFRDEQRDGGAA